jgi:hypothetical protein
MCVHIRIYSNIFVNINVTCIYNDDNNNTKNYPHYLLTIRLSPQCHLSLRKYFCGTYMLQPQVQNLGKICIFMYTLIYLSMHICAYTCIHIYIHICIHIHKYNYVFICIYIYMCIYIYKIMHKYIPKYICTCIYIMYIHIFIYV